MRFELPSTSMNSSAVGTMDSIDQPTKIFMGFEILVAFLCIVGNLLVVLAFGFEPMLRRHTNWFVFSLAFADLLVGIVGIPMFLYSMVTRLPADFHTCIVFYSWIMMLCTVSIFHLLAVSFDRFVVIVFPASKLNTSHRKRIRLIVTLVLAWILGILIGQFPVMGWSLNSKAFKGCEFMDIMEFSYLIFLYFGTIIVPTILMAAFYIAIYFSVARKATSSLRHHKRHKANHATRRKRVIVSLSIVVAIFFVCWYPLYTMNAITYFLPEAHISQEAFYVAIILSHLSSAVNPFIYAYTMPGFKDTFRAILTCKSGGGEGVLYPPERCGSSMRDFSGSGRAARSLSDRIAPEPKQRQGTVRVISLPNGTSHADYERNGSLYEENGCSPRGDSLIGSPISEGQTTLTNISNV